MDKAGRLTQQRLLRTQMAAGRDLPAIDSTNLPPGPRWPALIQSIALLPLRHRFVPWLRRRYGDVFTVRVLPRSRPLVIFSRPEHVKEIFAGDPAVFHAGKGNAILGPVMGEHSVLLVDGEQHKRARALLMPAFTAKALATYADLVREVAAAEVASWRTGDELRALDRMNALTLDVILRVVFGVTDEERIARLRPVVSGVVNVSPLVVLAWGMPRLFRFGPWKRAVDNFYELDRLIYAEIAERRTLEGLDRRTDVLSRLIRVETDGDRLSDPELRDQLVTLLLAGHETTASSLAWALHELGRDPVLRARTTAAVTSGDDDWLDAVLKESMRLHPVIAMVVRTLQRPATVAGIDLPAGATVGASILLAHSREASYPDVRAFRPERFLGQAPAPHTWIPFGGGVRRCIGAGFAQMEGVEVLRAVFAAVDVESLDIEHARTRNITSVPAKGARLRIRRLPVTRRESGAAA